MNSNEISEYKPQQKSAQEKSRSILITGCSSGIGLCAAETLHKRGYRVFATVRNRNDVEKIRAKGIYCTQLDLTKTDSIHTAVKRILQESAGELFAVFNNGAYGQPGAVEDLSRDTLRQQFEANVFGWLELTNMLIPVMRKQGYGRIIQNSSILGLVAMPFRGAYNASKFAIEGLTDTLRLELRNDPIHVSLIEPGPILSDFRKNALRNFKQNIDQENSVFKNSYIALQEKLEKEGAVAPFTGPADDVVKKLIHALESKRPKIRYYVTFPTYLFAFLRRILTQRMLDRLLKHF